MKYPRLIYIYFHIYVNTDTLMNGHYTHNRKNKYIQTERKKENQKGRKEERRGRKGEGRIEERKKERKERRQGKER